VIQTSVGGSNNSNCLSSQLQGNGRCTIKELVANELMTNAGSYDNLIECSVHNVNGSVGLPSHTISSGLRREGPGAAHSPIATAGDYFSDCDQCMTQLTQLTEPIRLTESYQANSIRLSGFLHLFVELFQNEYRNDAKRFYAKHSASLSQHSSNALVLEYLANSVKLGQLDKRLVKLRNSKTVVTVSSEFQRHLQQSLEVSRRSNARSSPEQSTNFRLKTKQKCSSNHLLFQLFNNHFCVSVCEKSDKPVTVVPSESVCLNLQLPVTVPFHCERLFERNTSTFKMAPSNDMPTDIGGHFDSNGSSGSSFQSNSIYKNLYQSSPNFVAPRLDEFQDICSRIARSSPPIPKMYAFRVQRDDSHITCADIDSEGSRYAIGLSNSQIDVVSIRTQSLFNLERAITGSSHVRKFVLDCEYNQSNAKQSASDKASALRAKHERVGTPDSGNNVGNKCNAPQQIKRTLYGHCDSVTDVRFFLQGERLLSSAIDGVVKLWQVTPNQTDRASGIQPEWSTKALTTYSAHLHPIWSLDVNSLNSHFSTASRDHSVRLFAFDRPQVLRVFAGHQAPVNSVRFHPNCRYVASGANDHSVRLWDSSSGQLVRVFVGHRNPVYALAFSPDGRLLASAGDDRTVFLWDLSAGKLLTQARTSHTQTINSLEFNADGRFLVSSSLDQLVCVWHVQSAANESLNVGSRLESVLVKDTGTSLRRVLFTQPDLLLGVGT
jgi:WD40 repeat protein